MELSTRYSALVDAKLRTELVLRDGVIFNNKYEGDPKAGSVKVRKTGTATVQDYNRSKGVNPTESESEWITVVINKDKAVNEVVDGYEASAVPDGIVADRLDEAARAIAVVLDQDGATELVTNGTVSENTLALTKTTIYNACVDARTALSKAGVPVNGRYLLVSPDTYALILKSSEFIKASDLGDSVIQTGAIGRIAGFNVYESSNLGENVEFVAGHPDYATRVNEWAVDVHVQDLNSSGVFIGASAVQGRKVYAHKVTEPKAFVVKKATSSTESI